MEVLAKLGHGEEGLVLRPTHRWTGRSRGGGHSEVEGVGESWTMRREREVADLILCGRELIGIANWQWNV
jgi:hypothetical protein